MTLSTLPRHRRPGTAVEEVLGPLARTVPDRHRPRGPRRQVGADRRQDEGGAHSDILPARRVH